MTRTHVTIFAGLLLAVASSYAPSIFAAKGDGPAPTTPLAIYPNDLTGSGEAFEVLTLSVFNGAATRRDNWKAGHDLPRDLRVGDQDYHKSGYARFHLARAADFGNQEMRNATFSYANCAPGNARLNGGLWSQIESDIAANLSPGVTAYVYTAPLWLADTSGVIQFTTIGPSRVWVPTHFAKAVLYRADNEWSVKAWIVPNEAPPDAATTDTYRAAIDDIEKARRRDLFAWLDDETEKRLEAQR